MNEQEPPRWAPPRWAVHVTMVWIAIGTATGLLLAEPRSTWYLTAYYGIVGGNALGLIAYVQIVGYGILEEIHMVISHWNNLRDKRKAEEKRAKELEQAREELEEVRKEAAKQGIERGIEQGLERGREQGLEQGLERGRREEREGWIAWNRRRMEAEKAGESFTEPPPLG